MVNLELIQKSQVDEGKNRIEVFKHKEARIAYMSDFAYVSSTPVYFDSEEDKKVSWWLSGPMSLHLQNIVDSKGNVEAEEADSTKIGTRLAFKFSDIKKNISDKELTINDFGIKEFEFGFFPQKIAKNMDVLEKRYGSKSLNCLHDIFYYPNSDGEIEGNSVYEYLGKKYIRIKAPSFSRYTENGVDINACWISYEPIVWYVDEKADIAISKNILVSGLKYNVNLNACLKHFSEVIDETLEDVAVVGSENYYVCPTIFDIDYLAPNKKSKLTAITTRFFETDLSNYLSLKYQNAYGDFVPYFIKKGMLGKKIYALKKEASHPTAANLNEYIRPVITFNHEFTPCEEIQYGYFPIKKVDDLDQKILRDKLDKGKFKYTGNEYHLLGSYGKIELVKEFINLDTGRTYIDYLGSWFEGEPIIWHRLGENLGTNSYILDKALTGFAKYDDGLEYLNKYFIKEINQKIDYKKVNASNSYNGIDNDNNNNQKNINEHVKTTNEKTKEIEELINEINKLKVNYHGDIDVNQIIEKSIDEYSKVLNNYESGLTLTLENNNLELAFITLKTELNYLLDILKRHCDIVKPYIDMLDIINNCINNYDNELSDDISDDIFILKNIIKDYGHHIDSNGHSIDTNEIEKLLIDFLNNENDIINKKIDDAIKNGKCTDTLDDLKIDFRKRFHKIVFTINDKISKSDIVSKIKHDSIAEGTSTYYQNVKEYLKMYYDIGDNLIKEINNNGNSKEKELVKKIDLDKYLNENNFDETINNLKETIIFLYKIKASIDLRKKENDNKVDVDAIRSAIK